MQGPLAVAGLERIELPQEMRRAERQLLRSSEPPATRRQLQPWSVPPRRKPAATIPDPKTDTPYVRAWIRDTPLVVVGE